MVTKAGFISTKIMIKKMMSSKTNGGWGYADDDAEDDGLGGDEDGVETEGNIESTDGEEGPVFENDTADNK
jgi:hypothetical protein